MLTGVLGGQKDAKYQRDVRRVGLSCDVNVAEHPYLNGRAHA